MILQSLSFFLGFKNYYFFSCVVWKCQILERKHVPRNFIVIWDRMFVSKFYIKHNIYNTILAENWIWGYIHSLPFIFILLVSEIFVKIIIKCIDFFWFFRQEIWSVETLVLPGCFRVKKAIGFNILIFTCDTWCKARRFGH